METTRRGFLQSAAAASALPFLPAGSMSRATAYALQAGKDPWWFCQFHAHCNPQPRSGPYIHLPRSTGAQVVSWYQRHLYHFTVAMTGLNVRTPTDGLRSVYSLPGEFDVLPSEEVSSIPDGLEADGIAAKGRIIDMLCLGSTKKADTSAFDDISGGLADTPTWRIIRAQIEAIEDAGGLPVTAHPTLTNAVNAQDFIRGWGNHERRYVEVFNGEPGIPNWLAERLWDEVLSTGRLVCATAGDDGFHYGPEWPDHAQTALRPGDRLAVPGKASTVIRAPELTWPALLQAMEARDFYASSGIEVLDYQVDGRTISLKLDTSDQSLGWSTDAVNGMRYRTQFIGKGGKLLAERLGDPEPSYTLTGTDLYARARVDDGRHVAWFQPVFR